MTGANGGTSTRSHRSPRYGDPPGVGTALITLGLSLIARPLMAANDLSLGVNLFGADARPVVALNLSKALELGHGLSLDLNPMFQWDENTLVADDFSTDGGLSFLSRGRDRRGMIAGTGWLSVAGAAFDIGLGIDRIHMGNTFEFRPTERLMPKDYLELPFPEDQEVPYIAGSWYLSQRRALKLYILPVDTIGYVPVGSDRVDFPYNLARVPAGIVLRNHSPAVRFSNLQGAAELDTGTLAVVTGRAFDNTPRAAARSLAAVDLVYDPAEFVGGWYSFIRGPISVRLNAVYVRYERGPQADRVEVAAQLDYQAGSGWLLICEYLAQERASSGSDTVLSRVLSHSVLAEARYRYRNALRISGGGIWRTEKRDGLLRVTLSLEPVANWSLQVRGAAFFGDRSRLLGQFRSRGYLSSTLSYEF